jgi:hypothetical protein
LWPLNFIATRSGMPARTMFRMAVRRKSCGMLPGQPAAIRARHPRVGEAAGRDRMAGPESDVAGFGWHVMEEDVLDDHALPTLNPISGLPLRLE